MAKSVLNESIWEKISEIDGKIDKVLGNLSSVKNEDVITVIRKYAESIDSRFSENRKGIEMLNRNISGIKETIENIQPPIQNPIDSSSMKVRKAYLIFAILGILIFILTIFSMKLYSDSLIYQNNYYRQSTIVRELQTKNDSLKVKIIPMEEKRKRKK